MSVRTPAAPRDPRASARGHHLVAAWLLGVLLVVASLLAALLPALAVVHLAVGLAVREVVVILVRWAASATLIVVTFLASSRTFVRTLLPTILPED